jgi:hypothetical protein
MGVHDVDTQNELVNEVDQLECQTSQRSRPVLVNEVDQLDAKLVNEVDQLDSVFTPISGVAKESILKKEIKKTTINTQKNTENAKGFALTDSRYAPSVVSSELSQEDNSSVPEEGELPFQEKQTYSVPHKEKPFSVKGKATYPNELSGVSLKPVLNHNSSLCEPRLIGSDTEVIKPVDSHKECASTFDQLKQEYEAPVGKKAIINWGETGRNIKAWLKAGYTAEDLRVVFVALKQDGWRKSALTMATIVKEGPNILAKQTPVQSSGEVANISDVFDAETIAAMGWDK